MSIFLNTCTRYRCRTQAYSREINLAFQPPCVQDTTTAIFETIIVVTDVLIVAVICLEPQILIPTTPWWKARACLCVGAEQCGDADGSTDRSFVNDVAMATTHPHRLANKTQNSNWGIVRKYVFRIDSCWLADGLMDQKHANGKAPYLLVVLTKPLANSTLCFSFA